MALYTRIWAELGAGTGHGPDNGWHDLTSDVLIEGLSLEYGLSGNRPSDCLASSGVLRFSLNNSANNSAATVGYYSPFHASKRAGWQAGVQVFVWITHVAPIAVSSITRSGTTVTVTTSGAHGYATGYQVFIEGAAQRGYNHAWQITVTGASTFTFQIVDAPTSPATGTITVQQGVPKWWGRIDSIDVEAGSKGPRRVHVTAYDRARDLLEADLYNVALQVNKTEDQILQAIFAALDPSIAPRAANYSTGIDQIPYALDDIGDGVKAGSVVADILRSSYGLGYFYNWGIFQYVSRHYRATAVSNGVIPSMTELESTGTIGTAYNLVRTTTHPRTVDASNVVLWSATGTPPYVPGSDDITVEGAFRSPDDATRLIGAASTVALVSGTDYAANSQDDGLGTSLSANQTVTPTVKASRVSFNLANGSATPAYYVDGSGEPFLQIRGKGLYDNGPRTFQATSAQGYGVRSFHLDLPYQNDDANGQQIADFILDQYDTLGTQIERVSFIATSGNGWFGHVMYWDVAHVITLSETVTGLSSVDAMILGVRLEWLTAQAVRCTWLLGPKITLTPPSVPTSLTATNTSDTSLSLTWATGTAGSYTQLFQDGIYIGTAGIGATAFAVYGLTPATNYTFTARHMYFGMPSSFTSGVVGRPVVAASGGTETTSGGYKYHAFNSSGNLTITVRGHVDVLMVAGGGGGGGGDDFGGGGDQGGGGGGAGGYRELLNNDEPTGVHVIVIGAAGNGGTTSGGSGGNNGVNGSNSSYRSETVTGGGYGGGGGVAAAGNNGGSGGGGSGRALAGAGGAGASGQGSAGGSGQFNPGGASAGGGGGGKGSVGGNATSTGGTAGTGVTGFDGVAYARGGVGGRNTSPAVGVTNRGDGGGGGQVGINGMNGFNGGSGRVVVRYPV